MRITAEVEKQIVALIRAGSRPGAAADSARVPRLVFRDWLEQGRQRKRGRYRQFWLNVCEARGQARAAADIEARKKDVKFWLRYGPGATSAGRSTRSEQDEHAPAAADFFQLLGRGVEILLPFPDARRAVLEAFDPPSDGASIASP